MDIDFFFQAEDGIRDLVRSRGLGDVYKRQDEDERAFLNALQAPPLNGAGLKLFRGNAGMNSFTPIKVSSTGQLVTNPCN